MTRFRIHYLLVVVLAFSLLACEEEKETQVKGELSLTQEISFDSLPAPPPIVEDNSLEGVELIELEHSYLQTLPESKEIEFQETGFAFPITYEINMAQAFIPAQKELQILDHESKKIHSALTEENYLLVDELFTHEVTTLNLDTAVKPSLICLGEKASVEWPNITRVEDVQKQEELAAKIDLKKNYKDAFEGLDGSLHAYFIFIADLPDVWEFQFNSQPHFIVSYPISMYEGDKEKRYSACFLLSPTEQYPLTGPCSFYGLPDIFEMDENLYLQGGSSCCECGIIVGQLFEFNGKELKTVLEDGSWST
ncbi:MAG: hypothetical protein AAFR87_06170 [Bacteroidota bacterium]